MNCVDHYQSLLDLQRAAFEEATKQPEFSMQAEAHLFVDDLKAWSTVLDEREECILLTKARTEYETGMLLLASGHYRPAFAALRSTLELSLTTIEHSAHHAHHRSWRLGQRDITWNALVDPDNGVLSKSFCKLYFDGLTEEVPHINKIAKSVYRNCSEYIHGNHTKDGAIPSSVLFSLERFKEWHEFAKTIRYVIHFALALRFLAWLKPTERQPLESCIGTHLGHLNAVQLLLNS